MIFADAAATWSPGPLYVALQPYLLAAFGAVFSCLLAWLCAILQKKTNIDIDQNARDRIQAAALNAAGRIIASQDEKIANIKVPIHSQLIQDEIPIVTDAVKGAIAQVGMTPDRVGAIIQGKLGQLQATAQAATPAVAVVEKGGGQS